MSVCKNLFIFFSVLLVRLYSIDVQTAYAYAISLENETVLLDKQSDELIYPASTTKVATALYILSKKADLEEKVVCSNRQALARISPSKKTSNHFTDPAYLLEQDGVFFGVRMNEEYTLKDLLYGLFLSSGNDAANVLAEHVSGSIEQFCEEMNEYVRSLGLLKTHFVNPHGLHHPEHVSTPRDMVILGIEAYKNELLRKIMGCEKYTIEKTNKQEARDVRQTNKLLRKDSPFYYSDALGMKTGNHLRAGKCLLAVAEINGRTIVLGLFKGKNWEETYGSAISVFDFIKTEKKRTRFLQRAGEVHYQRMLGKEKILGYLEEDIALEYYPSEKRELSTKLSWDRIDLPLSPGDTIGKLLLMQNEKIIGEYPLRVRKEYAAKGRGSLPFVLLFTLLALLLAVAGMRKLLRKN